MNSTEQYLEAQAAASEQVDVPTMVNYIIQDSLHRGASDIHIEPWEDMVGVRVRVNGVLQWLVGIPSDHHPNICGRFKVMANLESHTTGLPQDGKAAPENLAAFNYVSLFSQRSLGRKSSAACSTLTPRSLISLSSDSMMRHWKDLRNWPPNPPG